MKYFCAWINSKRGNEENIEAFIYFSLFKQKPYIFAGIKHKQRIKFFCKECSILMITSKNSFV